MNEQRNDKDDKKKAEKEEMPKGKPTSTQDTGPRNQVNEVLRGDDYAEEPNRLEDDELRDADEEHKGDE